MPRMSKKRKHELSFYLNDRGRVTYNATMLWMVWISTPNACIGDTILFV